MSVTGEADWALMKVGVGIADIMCGMYATTAILAAPPPSRQDRQGQHIDVSLPIPDRLAGQCQPQLSDFGRGAPARRQRNPNIVP
jgi:formyl-CoA transferase